MMIMKNKTKRTVLNNLGKVFNDQTGEIIEPEENKNYRIIIEESVPDNAEEDELIPFMTEYTFSKLFRGVELELDKRLTNPEVATLIFLIHFVCYGDCVLRKNGDARGKALSIKDLAEIRNMKYDTLRKIMNSLKDKDVIGFHVRGGQKWITVNPFILCRGIEFEPWIIKFYEDSIWAKIQFQETKLKR